MHQNSRFTTTFRYNPVIIIHWLVFYSNVRVIPKNLLFHRIFVLIIFFGKAYQATDNRLVEFLLSEHEQ